MRINLPFDEIFGSRVWPSNDPNDTPYNKFKCQLCDFEFKERIFGDFDIGDDPYDRVRERELKHILKHHISKGK